MEQQYTTLLLIVKDNKILLAEKKRGFGTGFFNGVGGKVEAGETIEQAMLRETKEEIGVTPLDYKKLGVVTFDEYVKGVRKVVIMSVFLAKDYEGKPVESEEMAPFWFDLNNIPYSKMFPDDKHWLPYLLSNQEFEGNFVYDEKFNLLEYSIKHK